MSTIPPEAADLAREAAAYVRRLSAAFPDLALGLRAGDYREALARLQEALEGLEWITRLAEVLGLEGDPRVPSLRDGCAALLEALESRDYVLVADLLEAEFGDAVAALADLLAPAFGPAH